MRAVWRRYRSQCNWLLRRRGRPGRVPGAYGDAAAAQQRLGAIGEAYLEFAHEEPGLFATAFAVPQQHSYGVPDGGTGPERTPLDQLRAALDELVDAGVLARPRRDGIEYPIWSTVHGLAVLTGFSRRSSSIPPRGVRLPLAMR